MPLGRLVSKLLGLLKRLQKCQTFRIYAEFPSLAASRYAAQSTPVPISHTSPQLDSLRSPQEILLPLFSSNEVSPCKTSHEPVERANKRIVSARHESINRSWLELESGNCWEQHSGSHQGSSSRLDEFDRKEPNQIAEQSHKQCRTNAFVANIGNHQAYLRTVEDEGIVEITRHLTSRCKSRQIPS